MRGAMGTTSSPNDLGQLPVYQRPSSHAWDVKTQGVMEQSPAPQTSHIEGTEASPYQYAPMGHDAHLPINHSDRPVLARLRTQSHEEKQQSSLCMYPAGDNLTHTSHLTSPSSLPPLPTSTHRTAPVRTPRPPLPPIPIQTHSQRASSGCRQAQTIRTPSMDRQFSRRDAKPMGARGLRKTGTVSGPHSEMSEGMARKEAERYMYRAPAWGSTSNSTVEIEDVNARASSSETPPAHVILPSLYEGDSPQEEAPPSFLDSRLDPVYSLDSHFSDLSLNQRADTSRLQTPSIVEEDDVDDANEEQEHEYDDEDRNGAVQVLTDNRPIIVNTHSAPAIQGNFSVDASANDPNPVRPSLNPHQRYSLPVSMHQPASHSHSTFVPSAPPNFMEEGPRILPPAGLFDHKMAYGNQDHRSVPVSAFYNSTVGTSMMKLGAFQSKPTRDRTGGITVMPGSDRGMTPSLNSGVDPMSPPRSASPTISLRSTGNSTGTGVMVDGSNPHSPVSGGTSSPANSTLHGRTASAVFGGVPSFGRGMPSPHTPPNAYPPVPNRQPRVLAPLAPGFVPGQTQLGGNQHPNFTMSPNAVARPSGALLQGQFGQQGLPYAGQRNANLYGLDTGLGPWG